MIDPTIATEIMVAFLIVMGIIIPVCGVIPKLREIISYRYLVVVVFLALSLAVIVDFSEVDTSIKSAVIVGTAILSGLFIILRSIEKAFYNRWIGGKIEASVEKGDIKAKVKLEPPKESKESPKENKDKENNAENEGLTNLAKYEQQ